ncbi:hypothetical protein Bca52824_069048 [Brassica carinata]|uniref:F-box domain-containing protein n=1 Tax=Brassica carinata TaxID=52824 RepID=A0A8X7Q6J2_BRACI|nr:hypothetical protein Bca52824_069048 [Brassica carinata]
MKRKAVKPNLRRYPADKSSDAMSSDRISELPDPLLTQILSHLPIIDSVKTSVLSKRWESLWPNVSTLDLNDRDVTPPYKKLFATFIDSFLEHNFESRLQTLKIKYDECNVNLFPISEWITTAVDLRGIQHLEVEIRNPMYVIDFTPASVYKSKTLVSLKLRRVRVRSLIEVDVVSLPCVKIMCLEKVCYGKEGDLCVEKLISGCPVLEDLDLVRKCDDRVKTLRVRSQSLKIFRLAFPSGMGDEYEVEIDAPALEYLSFKDNQSDRIVVKNLKSLVKVDVDSEFNVKFGDSEDLIKSDTIRDFLTGVSSVRQMIISEPTLEILYRYSKLVPVAEFQKLNHLQAAFSTTSLQLLLAFLESCPNLKNLVLDFSVSTESELINLTNVPRCLTSTLECVEINKLIMREETGIKLVNYFLENAAVVKKLSVSFTDSPMADEDLDIYKELLTSVKRSRICQVFIS